MVSGTPMKRSVEKKPSLTGSEGKGRLLKKQRTPNRYFTYRMLNHNCIIGKRIKGLDPDLPEERQLIVWYKKYPPKKARTEKQLKVLNEARKKRQSAKVIA